jgi:prevent-host-death family protein
MQVAVCTMVARALKMVSVTRNVRSPSKRKDRPRKTRPSRPGRWLLQDAKARFSELVRRAKSDGPQHVTVHGREEVVVDSTEEFRRLKGELTGRALVEVMSSSPLCDIEIQRRAARLPVRDVKL